MKKTLEEYLLENYEKGIISHTLTCGVYLNSGTTFYIHATGKDSDTLDFQINGNELTPVVEYK